MVFPCCAQLLAISDREALQYTSFKWMQCQVLECYQRKWIMQAYLFQNRWPANQACSDFGALMIFFFFMFFPACNCTCSSAGTFSSLIHSLCHRIGYLHWLHVHVHECNLTCRNTINLTLLNLESDNTYAYSHTFLIANNHVHLQSSIQYYPYLLLLVRIIFHHSPRPFLKWVN